MSLLCSTSCGTIPDVPSSYWNCTDNFRDFGSNHFALVRCDYEFTDILDPAEWAAAIAANQIHLSPPGNLTLQAPTVTSFIVEGCGREATGSLEYLIDFTTYQTSDDLSDVAFWKDVFENAASYRIVLIDCNNIFTLGDSFAAAFEGGAPATVAGENPGLEFSVVIPPHQVEGEGDLSQWSMQFKLKKSGLLCSALLPGIVPVLA